MPPHTVANELWSQNAARDNESTAVKNEWTPQGDQTGSAAAAEEEAR
jgi:hypothetical protein